MSGIVGAINTALSGIEAFESGINTVSNNLANETVNGFAAAPGYDLASGVGTVDAARFVPELAHAAGRGEGPPPRRR